MIDTKEYLLDALAESKDASTRSYAAYRGRKLDKLVNDPAPEVRAVVALRKGYCVQMINDEDATVQAVAWWALDHGEA